MKDRIRLEVSQAEVITLLALVVNAVQKRPSNALGPSLPRLLAYLYRKAKEVKPSDKTKGKTAESAPGFAASTQP